MPKLSSQKLIEQYKEEAAHCGADLMEQLIRETHPDSFRKMNDLSWRFLTLMLAAHFRVGAKSVLNDSHVPTDSTLFSVEEIEMLKELGWLDE